MCSFGQSWNSYPLSPWSVQGRNSIITGVDDAADFQATRQAFSLLGISDTDQMAIFRVLAAILHLGNIEIGGNDHAEVYSEDQVWFQFGF